jgi:hypothetical protein
LSIAAAVGSTRRLTSLVASTSAMAAAAARSFLPRRTTVPSGWTERPSAASFFSNVSM